MNDIIRNIDNNTVKIGREQTEGFKDIKARLQVIENNQNKLSQNMIWLDQKLDKIIALLEQNSSN